MQRIDDYRGRVAAACCSSPDGSIGLSPLSHSNPRTVVSPGEQGSNRCETHGSNRRAEIRLGACNQGPLWDAIGGGLPICFPNLLTIKHLT